MLCEHCGQVEREVGAPCPSCKFQPYGEEAESEIQDAAGGELLSTVLPTPCPECGTPRSAPNEPCERCKELDVCPTPDALALAIVRRLSDMSNWHGCVPNWPAPRILEPSAGDGAFVRAARQVWPASEITAVEIREQCHSKIVAAGANHTITDSLEGVFTSGAAELGNIDLCIGNPPFTFAENHIRLLLEALRPGAVLAFLLRTGFYESHTRISFWNEFPEDSFAPIVPRPGFKLNKHGKKGTDSQSYGLFIWTKRMIDPPGRVRQRADHIVWRDPAPRGRKRAIEQAPMADVEQGERSGTGIPTPEALDLE